MDYSRLGTKRNMRKQSPHTARIRNKAGLLVLRIALSLVLIAVFAAGGAGVGLYFGILSYAPRLTVDMVVSDYQSSFIINAHTGEIMLTLHAGHNHERVLIDQIPYHVRYAFIAIEDERFFDHNGVDIRGMGRALHALIDSGGARTEGASTITQQLIKNMLERWESDIIFKLQEQYLAVNYERYLTELFGCRDYAKLFILESYLNIINLGRSNYGVQAAAQFYFGVDVWDLSIAQAASIASITQNPRRFPPDTRPEANRERTVRVLNNMLRLGFITEEEHYEAINTNISETLVGGVGGDARPIESDFDCFTAAMLDDVRDDLVSRRNMPVDLANRLIFSGGLQIFSTQDLEMQAIVDRVFLDESYWPESDFSIDIELRFSVYNTFSNQLRSYRLTNNTETMEEAEEWVEEAINLRMTPQDELRDKVPLFTPQPQAAFVLLDHHTGHVLALRGVRGERGANRILNRATQSTRSPGSQMKPIAVFGPAFDMGIMQPGTVIDDEPFTYVDPWTGVEWTPRNHWSAGRWYGPSTVRAAVYYSMNVVSARATIDPTIPHVGIEAMFRYLRNMGITTLADGFDGAAVSLGGMHHGVRLIELAGAYGMVANEGLFNRPVLYTLVLDADGNVLLENPVNPTRVLSDTAAFLLTDTMKNTLTASRGTGHAANWLNNPDLRRDIPIAGKTGTSQDRRDLGFSGSTAYYTASIWMGNDNNEPMTRGVHRSHMHAWRSIMQEIHENLPPRQFPRPADGRIVRSTICMDSGMLEGELCRHDSRGSRISTDIFDSRFVPTQTCELHAEFTYCVEYGYLAGPYCPAHVTSTRIGILKDDETFGGFPQPVLDGIVCPHHSTPDLTLPWEHPDFLPPTQGDGPPITLWPDFNLPPPPMPDPPPQDDLSLPPEFDDFFDDTDDEDDSANGI